MIWCDRMSQLSGAWIAKQPPEGSMPHRRGTNSSWSGTHWITALEKNTDGVSVGRQPARSPSSHRTLVGAKPSPDPAACASISGELSMPMTSDWGQRSASSRVTLPLPQPRS